MSDECDVHPKRLSTKTINSSEVVKGKTLFDEANDKVRLNLKKALAHANEWLNDGELPSGKSKEDCTQHMREMMCSDSKVDKENDKPVVVLEGGSEDEDDEGAAANGSDDENVSDEVPPHWMFEGHLAFFAAGPLSNDPSLLLNAKDPADKSAQDSRKAFRKKQAEEKQANRSGVAANQLEGPLGKRGCSMQENLTVARMWQHDMQQQHRFLADKIMAAQMQLTSPQEDAKLAAESARATGEECDWKECRELRAECKIKRAETAEISKKADEMAASDVAVKLQSFFDSMMSPRKLARTDSVETSSDKTSTPEATSGGESERSGSLTA